MKVLVIGGAGYIGSHVARELLDNGQKVIVYDNLSTGKEANIFADEEFIKGDILDYDNLLKVMKNKIDAVILLAGKKAVGESMENPQKYAITNIIGTINVLNAMVEAKVKNIVFSSSAAVYGMPKYFPLDENHPLEPINFYGFTKMDVEKYLSWYDRLKGIKFVALRYFNAVGYDKEGRIKAREEKPQNLMPIVMETITGIREKMQVFGNDYDTKDGTCVRDYIHVTDLADAHYKAIKYLSEGKESQILNLGTAKGVSVLEMINKTEEVTKRKVNYEFAGRRAGDPASLTAKADKAKEVLDWEAKHSSIENIIATTWNMYK